VVSPGCFDVEASKRRRSDRHGRSNRHGSSGIIGFAPSWEEAQDYVVVTIVVDWVMVTQLLRLVLALALVNDEGRRRRRWWRRAALLLRELVLVTNEGTMARDGRGRMGACVRTHLAPAMIGGTAGAGELACEAPNAVDRDLLS